MLWCDGRLVAGPVPFDLSDRGLLLGDGVFDTALALGGRVAFEEAHVARLVAAARTLGFAVAPERVVEAMRAVAGTAPRTAIRTTVTRGPGPRGIAPPAETKPLLFASAAPARSGLAFTPMRLHRTAIRRNETSPTSRLKTLGYLDAVLAAREATAAGFDETLFLNTGSRVACAGIGNVFGMFGQRLVTPSLEEGVLPGIVRAQICSVAPSVGLAVEERPLPLDELLGADAVFLTNSLRLVSPVTAIGEHLFESAENPAVAQLSRAMREAVAASCGVGPESVS
ncbi:aminotransferase class IV [Methylobacterium haplocladii]|uniref:Probable branched-chain-amino-acid aminotransferase n=1 Tax=Methylobacterium haplocladii TaxID=1176176 RepID=A0A512ITZ5_9HYPH|nr:aminotransferase class IV [Methylobacterium haplocladii]GEP01180.1 4-amino-4-deoxychorismate lyase [Methylobacterium haplocladii]GJD82861.1 Aminodeoxychorismate lyase [Methylobacterium haplocladii]GLS58996.1 4-amino-4-deoxychorismate lyase [Methylobacterium haplocladii]